MCSEQYLTDLLWTSKRYQIRSCTLKNNNISQERAIGTTCLCIIQSLFDSHLNLNRDAAVLFTNKSKGHPHKPEDQGHK